jgi:hypothetical protein
MSAWLIAGIGLVYFYIGCDLLFKGNTGLAISFFGYALGNVGLYIVAKAGVECGIS